MVSLWGWDMPSAEYLYQGWLSLQVCYPLDGMMVCTSDKGIPLMPSQCSYVSVLRIRVRIDDVGCSMESSSQG